MKVEAKSYSNYFKLAGGFYIVILFNFIILFYITTQMYANYLIQKWAFADETTQQEKYEFYAITLFSVYLLSAFTVFGRSMFQVLTGLRVGRKLHNILIAYVFRAPINLFFDVTPIGKILNRFSKDMAVVDEQIYYNLGGFVICLWNAVAALVVAAVAVPYILVIIGLFLICGVCIFTYAMRAFTDCYRIESVTMSPILSFFQETFNGNSVIRAFGKEEFFRE